jgi:TonB family protein
MSSAASTASTAAKQEVRSYALKSDIAQFCLPAASKDINRRYAYANSICLSFLVIGCMGIQTPLFAPKEPPIPEDIVPVIFTPPPEEQPPQTPDEVQPDEPDRTSDVADTPVIATVVAASTETVAFSVPVEGPVILAPAKYAPPPPPVDRPKPAAVPKPPERTRFQSGSGEQGSFQRPPFVAGVLRRGESALVEYNVDVGEDGSILNIEVAKSSGSLELDRKTLNHIKLKWRWAPGKLRKYIVPIEFQVN